MSHLLFHLKTCQLLTKNGYPTSSSHLSVLLSLHHQMKTVVNHLKQENLPDPSPLQAMVLFSLVCHVCLINVLSSAYFTHTSFLSPSSHLSAFNANCLTQ